MPVPSHIKAARRAMADEGVAISVKEIVYVFHCCGERTLHVSAKGHVSVSPEHTDADRVVRDLAGDDGPCTCECLVSILTGVPTKEKDAHNAKSSLVRLLGRSESGTTEDALAQWRLRAAYMRVSREKRGKPDRAMTTKLIDRKQLREQHQNYARFMASSLHLGISNGMELKPGTAHSRMCDTHLVLPDTWHTRVGRIVSLLEAAAPHRLFPVWAEKPIATWRSGTIKARITCARVRGHVVGKGRVELAEYVARRRDGIWTFEDLNPPEKVRKEKLEAKVNDRAARAIELFEKWSKAEAKAARLRKKYEKKVKYYQQRGALPSEEV